jgi:hypothetical protein
LFLVRRKLLAADVFSLLCWTVAAGADAGAAGAGAGAGVACADWSAQFPDLGDESAEPNQKEKRPVAAAKPVDPAARKLAAKLYSAGSVSGAAGAQAAHYRVAHCLFAPALGSAATAKPAFKVKPTFEAQPAAESKVTTAKFSPGWDVVEIATGKRWRVAGSGKGGQGVTCHPLKQDGTGLTLQPRHFANTQLRVWVYSGQECTGRSFAEPRMHRRPASHSRFRGTICRQRRCWCRGI